MDGDVGVAESVFDVTEGVDVILDETGLFDDGDVTGLDAFCPAGVPGGFVVVTGGVEGASMRVCLDDVITDDVDDVRTAVKVRVGVSPPGVTAAIPYSHRVPVKP